MATLVIEINDAEIRTARGAEVVAVEPGCALLDGEALVTGVEASRALRLRPRQAFDRFWADLGQAPLPHPHPRAGSLADLAFAQLTSLWERFGEGVEEVVFIVGHLRETMQAWIEAEYPSLRGHYVLQEVQDGTAGAIALAEPYVDEDDYRSYRFHTYRGRR